MQNLQEKEQILKDKIIKLDYEFKHEKQIIGQTITHMFSGLFDDEYEEYMNIPLTIYVTDNKSVFVHTYYVNEDEVKLGERDIESMYDVWFGKTTFLEAWLDDRIIIDEDDTSENTQLPFIDIDAYNDYLNYLKQESLARSKWFIESNCKFYGINYQHGKLLDELGLKSLNTMSAHRHITDTFACYDLSRWLFHRDLYYAICDHPGEVADLNGKRIDVTCPYIGWFEKSDFDVNTTLYIFESVLNYFRQKRKQKTISVYLIPDAYFETSDKADIVTLLFVTDDHVLPEKLVKYKIKSNWTIERTIEPLIETMIQAVSINPNVRV